MGLKRALFLDRDGVINKEKNYTFRKEDFEFIDGIFDFCKYFISKGYLIFIITNQAGIARGYYGNKDFNILNKWMLNEFYRNGIEITKVYYCPHHPEFTGECECRKPEPGMILKAESEYGIELNNSVLVGDKQSDLEAGMNAGIKNNFLFKESSDFKKIITAIEESVG